MCNKSQLRIKHKYLRNQMPLMDVMRFSEVISTQIIESTDFQEAKVIFGYMATMNEVQVRCVLEEALLQGKTVALPKVIQKEMVYFQVDSLDQVQLGAYNIMEPVSERVLEPKSGDLMLVPGVAFDLSGYRIGYGGGYYDRYISRFASVNYKTYGVCYSNQRVEAVAYESFDQPVDLVISE